MKIKFENGSKIEMIDSKEGTKRGYIRGRRLTDKEYREMIDNEIFQTEYRVSKILKELGFMSVERYKEYYETLKRNPSAYIEELYGIKLFPFQKVFLNIMCKAEQISYRCNPFYKYERFKSLCLAYINMKDDAKIIISSSDGDKIMSKEEFGEWLEKKCYKYWRK